MADLIDRAKAIKAIEDMQDCYNGFSGTYDKAQIIGVLEEVPSAQPERLTDDDFETIRIHLNAYKEKLCNQQRWGEAEEYQRIIDRFMAFASARPETCAYWDRESNICALHRPSAQPETAKRTAESVQNVPKDELISRKAAIEVIDAVFPVDPMKSEYAQGIACGAALAKTYVAQLPTAERKGHWVNKWHTVFKEDLPCCSECSNFMAFTFDYCPNCGARMDGEQ